MASVYIGDSKSRVAIFGDIMLDHTIEGSSSKIANEAPVPVIQFEKEKYSIGGCGNVVLNVGALGAENIYLFSRIGTDTHGQIIQSVLPSNIINHMIRDPEFTTITKHRIYCERKLMCRYDNERIYPINVIQEQNILERFQGLLETTPPSSVIFSDYNKGFLTKSLCQGIIGMCNKYGIPTIVDPKIDYRKYIGCTVIKPNKSETRNIFNIDLNTTNTESAHSQIQSIMNCSASVLTLSGDGISARKDNHTYHITEDTKDVIDVTGAGDVVCSVLGTYYPFISDFELLIRIANHLASISVSHLGVYTITNTDLINTHKFIHKTKQIKLEHLPHVGTKKVVFTNGCFDILHSAHLEVFKYCRQLGDIVIVGLNSDASIKRLKGDTRPINCLEERIKMLSAIETIDFIIPFDEDTPLNLIKTIKPDYLVKGGDYSPETIVGREYALNTVVFNYIEGLSTTNTIQKIRK